MTSITAASSAPEQKRGNYDAYILPWIKETRKGDELLFMSPSVFFGYYTYGAKTFVEVCEALKEAKRRGVRIQLIIDVHDIFCAKAAEGLLTFLKDGTEVRHADNIVQFYLLIVLRQDKPLHCIELSTDKAETFPYLPDIEVRKAGKPTRLPQEYEDHEYGIARNRFDHFWDEKQSRKITEEISKYHPLYQIRRYFQWYQMMTYTGVLTIGLLLGVLFSFQSQPSLELLPIVIWFFLTIATGMVSNYVSGAISKRLFR
jgi:hypothetical protein